MNLPKAISLLFILCMLTACIREDMSKCGECEGIILNFEYPNFPNKINKVNIGIFDKDGSLVESRLIDKESLTEFQGIKLGLESGNYTAVCWGNAFDNTQIKGLSVDSKLNNMEVSHPNSGSSKIIETSDSLFYGKHVFTIPSDRKYVGTVKFKPAFIRFKVAVKGLDVKQNAVAIRITNLKTYYNSEMQTYGELSNYIPPMIATSDKMWVTHSDVFRFDYDNPIKVDLLNAADNNNILASVDIKDFVKNNNISLDENTEVTIPILFNFTSGNISINPEIGIWDESTVIPEW